jgi:hypothetical protein
VAAEADKVVLGEVIVADVAINNKVLFAFLLENKTFAKLQLEVYLHDVCFGASFGEFAAICF